MKYLFVVNSNITALSARAIIEYEKLPHDDMIILSMRGALVKGTQLKHIDFIYPHIVNPIPHTRNLFKAWNVLAEFDEFIDEVTSGEDFFCFVNHNMARNTELLVNHPRCTGFSIMEEGGAAYNSKEFFEQKYHHRFPSIWDLLGYRNRIRRRYFYRPDYVKVYAVTPKAFPGFERKVLLDNIFSSSNSEYSEYDGSKIIVFDGVVSAGLIDVELYIKGLSIFFAAVFLEKDLTIYYKFHPAQDDSERLSLTQFLDSVPNITFVRLSDEIILEELIVVAKDLTMYFNFSTISIYANNLGHKCFSFSEILGELNEDYNLIIQNLNETLKESFVQIKA